MLVWAAALPVLAVLSFFLIHWTAGLVVAALYPAQMTRIASRMRRDRDFEPSFARMLGFFLVAGKFAQLKGALRYHWRRLTGSRAGLIEYKGAEG